MRENGGSGRFDRARIREQTNQDSRLRNKVLRPPPAVGKLLSSRLGRRDRAVQAVGRALLFFPREGSRFVRANHLTTRERAKLCPLFLTKSPEGRDFVRIQVRQMKTTLYTLRC